MIEVESFEQARTLDRAELEVLRASPRPEQRLWAIWTLALGLDAAPPSLAAEPDPGVRRHLAVVLAGHGEHALLLELATQDPSLLVRESALGLIVRIAAGTPATDPREAPMRHAIEQAERTPELRPALLGAIPPAAPGYQLAIALRGLDDRAHEIQAEAFEALLRQGGVPALEAARGWLRVQPDPASHVERWLRHGSAEALAETLAGLPVPLRGAVLAKLHAPPWPAVELLIGEDHELLRTLLVRSDVAIPAHVLARAVLRGGEHAFVERLRLQLELLVLGRALLAELRHALLSGEIEDEIHDLRAGADKLARALEVADRTELLAELAGTHPVEQGMALEHAVVRWLAAVEPAAELDRLLAELEHHVAQRVAVMRASGASRRPQRGYAELGDDRGAYARYALFGELEALQRALVALTART